MPSFRQKFSSLYKKNQYDRFDKSGGGSNQHILQDTLSDDDGVSFSDDDDDEFPSAPTPIHEYDGKEPLRGIISDFGDVKNHKVITHSSYSSDMDIIGAKTIDESGVNISAFNDDNNNSNNSSGINDDNIRLIHSPNGSTSPIQFITKPSLKQSKTFHYSKQFTSSYNVKGEGRSDIRKLDDSNQSSRKSFDGSFFRSHKVGEITQSASLTSISAIAPGYTITKKASFKLFPSINLVGDDENMESK
ncbi:predicted protein [Naegleria gruberi]|uniref:Predicted protein n=1 Tax=Naegleria gruberi TaxID=5762 RepID=D2W2D7_NAEGR|nr:uncharacterized protein NAEGRDRAFT_75552 [Naegleria gruberi]EFC36843.1 predicted protein [Naegleria gruberi]|eukprot:XP_002669587.1 predicted protein [Naegleria gruberi strain NEG-M]